MGSKNRIFLAVLTPLILHKIRNRFKSNKIYITKSKLKKIKQKHNIESYFLHNENFQTILDNTIGICSYKHDNKLINFISIVEGSIYLYSISANNFHIHLGTFFKSDKRKILKQCSNKIDFLSNTKKKLFEEFI